jgi:hypothetical protein
MNAAPQDIIDLKCFAFNCCGNSVATNGLDVRRHECKAEKRQGCRRVSRLSKPSTVNVPTFALMR